MDKRKYKVSGMSCAACVARVEKAVSSLDGVELCEVNLLLGTLDVLGNADDKSIAEAVKAAGYSLVNENSSDSRGAEDKSGAVSEIKLMLMRLIPSAILLLLLMYISMGHLMLSLPLPAFLAKNVSSLALTEFLICTAIMVINKHFFHNGAKGIVHLAPNMDTLISLGSLASYLYSIVVLYLISADIHAGSFDMAHERLHGLYFESAAMILVLITVGKLLEALAKGKTTSAIRALMDLAPKTATVIRDGKETVIPAKDILVGDIFVVKRGENIAADGVIVEGEISVDESALTGESLPKDMSVSASVLGATTVLSGYAKIRAEKVGEKTAIAEVIKMVKEASGSKAPVAKAADKVAAVFVPAVLAISLLTFAVWMIIGKGVGFSLARAVTVLVISCPCALGLATPVAIMVGTGVGAARGVLFKNARALEAAGKIKAVAFDKTGTVTEGTLEVTDIFGISVDNDSLIRLSISLEEKSEHPLARAIVRYKEEKGISDIPKSEAFTAFPFGVSAKLGGREIYSGNPLFIEQKASRALEGEGLLKFNSLKSEGKTVLIIAEKDNILGLIALSDKIKEDSKAAISELKALGVKTFMITGDSSAAAEYVATRVGISEVVSDVMPGEKASCIKELSRLHGSIAMVGDGINDSVALTSADVGIAIGKGADIAIDSADVVLTRGSLKSVAAAIKLGRRTLLCIYENLFWAFIYNIIGIPLAAGLFIAPFGWELKPMFGAAAMSLSSFFVVMNALRLNLYNPEKSKIRECKNEKTETIVYNKGDNTMKTLTIKIDGMMCPHCSGRVKTALEASELVVSADVSHERKDAVITLASDSASVKDALAKIIEDAGYKVVD